MNENTQRLLVIIIPCYNEASEFKREKFQKFINANPNVHCCFVNDGSKDRTWHVLQELKSSCKQETTIINSQNNLGKAGAVLLGFQHFAKSQLDYTAIGYLDCDLSAPLEEIVRISSFVDGETVMCFGSRIKKIDTIIERKFYRFLIGRLIATIISNIFHLNSYDTQCGCKVFSKDLAGQLFVEPFISRWLFDVEIFLRIIKLFGRKNLAGKLREEPLQEWIDYGNSKLKFTYVFGMAADIYKIFSAYGRKLNR